MLQTFGKAEGFVHVVGRLSQQLINDPTEKKPLKYIAIFAK
jgi:hypothetical protein